jgi:hypothetical protein
MPSGHVPLDALKHPELYTGLDCRISIPQCAINDIREYVIGEVGPREEHLAWVSKDFDSMAHDVYTALGSPSLTLNTSWDVFASMSNYIAAM